jgi:hypothetical protein
MFIQTCSNHNLFALSKFPVIKHRDSVAVLSAAETLMYCYKGIYIICIRITCSVREVIH